MGGSGMEERKTLADIILDKIQEKEKEQQQEWQNKRGEELPNNMMVVGGEHMEGVGSSLPEKVVEVSLSSSSSGSSNGGKVKRDIGEGGW